MLRTAVWAGRVETTGRWGWGPHTARLAARRTSLVPRLLPRLLRPASTAATTAASVDGPYILRDPKDPTRAYLRYQSDIPLLKETVGQVLQRTALKYPERDAVVSYYQNKRITYQDLLKKVGTGSFKSRRRLRSIPRSSSYLNLAEIVLHAWKGAGSNTSLIVFR